MKFFNEKYIELLDWPAQSTDLNIVEDVWAYIIQKLDKLFIKTIQELKEIILKYGVKYQ